MDLNHQEEHGLNYPYEYKSMANNPLSGINQWLSTGLNGHSHLFH